LLGHEGSGTVIAIGPKVTKVKIGDDVIMGWIVGDGIEAAGAKYKQLHTEKIINSGKVTTFSNYSIVAENRLVKKPKDMEFDVAILFGCALPTGAGMVINELRPLSSHTFVVLGLGGIGISALIALKALGLNSIIAVDHSLEKINFARSLQIWSVIDSSRQNPHEEIMRLTNGVGADFCIESCGTVSTIELGFSFIKAGSGHLKFASHPPEGDVIKILPHDLIKGKKISGSWGGGVNPDNDIPKIYELLSRSGFLLNKLITKRYYLEEINDALNDLESGNVFRPLIKMTHFS
jgi:S-(hydroxymethyl)glutathione dehydrogenase/alcohol dehydrogenase